MKMKVELELQQRKKKVNPPKVNYANKPEEVKIQRATEINVKSLENLVEYIEGPSSKAVVEQKKADEAAAKKQLKKAKQLELKIRRQIDLHIEQLAKLNGDLQEVVIDAKQVQNQLSQLKAGKGKNKELKKVKVAEEKLSELNSRRLRLENDAKGICSDIKILNPNVDLIRECCEMRTISGLLNPSLTQIPAPYAQQQQHQPRPPVAINNTRPVPVRIPPSQNQQKPSEEDPAKRMVTIRRINLPHAEPQVTVTAKGTTPDMDQLLYTFVNGQLVPASSLSPSAFQNGSIQLFMSSNGQKKLVVENRMQQQQQQPQQRISKMNEAPSPITIMQHQQQTTDKNKKKQPTPVAPVVEKTAEKSKKSLKKSDKKKEETPIANKKESKKLELSKAQETEKKLDIKLPEQNKSEASHVDKKKKKKVFIDPEFASNPFKLLDDEQHSDSEDEVSVASSDLNEPIKRMEDFSSKTTNAKKGKEDKKAAKKQANVQIVQQSSKADKNVQKKPTQPATAKVNISGRQGSISSVMNSK